MDIPYYLQDLHVGPDQDQKVGKVQPRGSLNEEDLLNRMDKRGTGISWEDMQATLNLLTQEVSDALADGYTVNMRLANYRPGLKGVFSNATDAFDASRHYFRASISEGVVLKKKMREASGERVTVPLRAPRPIQYEDHGSETIDSVLTPESIGEINGEELKYDSSNDSEGIYFIATESGEATKVETVSILTDGRLMFMVPPSLDKGQYTLEVRRAYTNEGTIRIGTFHHSLTVE